MEPTPNSVSDIDPAPVRVRAGADAFVVDAWDAHHTELFAYLARATRERSVAEDLLQEAFLRLTGEARAGRAPEQVRAWLFRVATNLVIGRSRRRATALRWLGGQARDERGEGSSPSPEIVVLERERTAELDQVLTGLSPDARVALLLSGQGFSGDEIANAIGRSGSATRALLCRARARVRLRRELFGEASR